MIFQCHPIGKSPLHKDIQHFQAREAGVKRALEVIQALEHRTMVQSLVTIQEVNRRLRQPLDFMHAHKSVSQQVSKDQALRRSRFRPWPRDIAAQSYRTALKVRFGSLVDRPTSGWPRAMQHRSLTCLAPGGKIRAGPQRFSHACHLANAPTAGTSATRRRWPITDRPRVAAAASCAVCSEIPHETPHTKPANA